MMEEQWKPVVDFEGLYEVSALGSVRSVDHIITRSNGAKMRIAPRVLKSRRQKSGHLLLWLRKDGKTHAVCVHRLVAAAFLGPCPDGMECCHNNGVAWDNRVENLRWDTRSANIKQSYLDGRQPTVPGLKGLGHPCSVLSAEAVRLIRESPLSCVKAGKAFGVSAMTVSRCRQNTTYQDVA